MTPSTSVATLQNAASDDVRYTGGIAIGRWARLSFLDYEPVMDKINPMALDESGLENFGGPAQRRIGQTLHADDGGTP